MPLVDSKAMLIYAMEHEFAVGAFNANNMEIAQAIVEAAEEEKAPVIVQISQGAIEYAGENCLFEIVKVLADKAKVPVVCHLDHGVDFHTVIRALRAGFTSLMFDGSSLPFEENVKITKNLVEMAHAAGVPLEAEIGKVPDAAKGPLSPEEIKKYLTTPEEAQDFFERTGVDSLAVSVGSAHRMKVQSAELDIERIARIREKVKAPLVLHGASGVKDDSVVKAIRAGIAKINFATELNKAFTTGIKQKLSEDPGLVDVRKYGAFGRENVKKVVKEKIRLLDSANKAEEVLKFIQDKKLIEDKNDKSKIVE
ncbi:MAG: fructose-bisphosphate aldolase, class [Thermoanaerobacteraceae bacterium]|nr:fructose-bisphosphate aldolase, class [Thermoanaerobacteraceae bacterium]